MNKFMKELKQYRHSIPKQTLKSIRGQALAGDLVGAKKGLENVLDRKQSNKDRMSNAHRGTRYMTKQYGDVDYRTQLSINLKS